MAQLIDQSNGHFIICSREEAMARQSLVRKGTKGYLMTRKLWCNAYHGLSSSNSFISAYIGFMYNCVSAVYIFIYIYINWSNHLRKLLGWNHLFIRLSQCSIRYFFLIPTRRKCDDLLIPPLVLPSSSQDPTQLTTSRIYISRHYNKRQDDRDTSTYLYIPIHVACAEGGKWKV